MQKVDKDLGKFRKFQYSNTYLSREMIDLKSKTVKMTALIILVLSKRPLRHVAAIWAVRDFGLKLEIKRTA